MNRQYPEFSHHNILFSENYEREFIDIFENKIPADDMTIYVSISSKMKSMIHLQDARTSSYL